MAQSKHNRKKSKKKNKHAASRREAGGSAQRARSWNRTQRAKFISLGVLVVGFLVAMLGGTASLIGYPISFAGAVACLVQTPWDTTNHKITKVVLCMFCILSAIQFVLLLTGNA